MKSFMVLMVSLLMLTLVESGCVVAAGPPPPPEPVAEYYGPAPYEGAVWVQGNWAWHPEHRRYEWHHGEWRHH